MSTNLYWSPISKRKSLPGALKFAIQKRFQDRTILCLDEHAEYLHGLVDAGVEGALDLLTTLEKYKSVEIWYE